MRQHSASPGTNGARSSEARSTTFGHLRIGYDDRVLAPREWTVAQASWAAQLLRDAPAGRLLELCAGVGHMGLMAASSTSRAALLVDIDPEACAHAEANALRAGLGDRIEVRHADLETFAPRGELFPVVIADPPWVPHSAVRDFPEDPPAAIDGGRDGLDLARACVQALSRCLHPEGSSLLQLGSVGQIHQLDRWVRRRPELGLRVREHRSHGERGVLVRLARSGV